MQIRPATPDLDAQLEDLMDSVAPASRCSCMYWRIGTAYRDRTPVQNRSELLAIVEAGPPPGLLALEDDTAVGWVQVTPRDDLKALERSRFVDDVDAGVWAISCFVIRPGHRRRGVATALVEAAIDVARRNGASAVEAYPLDADRSTSSTFTGYASTFQRLGFATARYAQPSRPVMRLVLRPPLSSPDGVGSAGR